MKIQASAGREGNKRKESFDSFCKKLQFDAQSYTDAVRNAATVRMFLTGYEKDPLVIAAVEAHRKLCDKIHEENEQRLNSNDKERND